VFGCVTAIAGGGRLIANAGKANGRLKLDGYLNFSTITVVNNPAMTNHSAVFSLISALFPYSFLLLNIIMYT
jgi:hypothetical protein